MISLRTLKKEDAPFMLEWMHDEEIQKSFRANMLSKTIEDVCSFIDSAEYDIKDKTSIHYAIVNSDDEYIGTISLKNFDCEAKTAEYAISIRSAYHGKGIGTIATKMLLEKAFKEFGLERVYLNVLSDNHGAIKMYEKCGFIFEGEFREHLFLHGEKKSLMWYAILKREFIK